METKLLHGDCYEIIPTLPDNSISLVVTDPPFNFQNHGGGSLYKKGTQRMETLNKLKDLDCWEFSPRKFLDLLFPKMESFYGYFFCNKLLVDEYIAWAKEHKFKFDVLAMISASDSIESIDNAKSCVLLKVAMSLNDWLYDNDTTNNVKPIHIIKKCKLLSDNDI